MRKKLGIIFGGMSTEHDVSIVSGLSVIKNLDKSKYDITAIYIEKNGDWFLYTKNLEEVEILKVGEQPKELEPIENPFKLLKGLDVVFPVLHGLYGEDGTIQGMLELMKIPYVGCKVLSSSLCMDKVYTKMVLEKAKMNQVEYSYIKKLDESYVYVNDEFDEIELTLEEIASKIIKNLELPIFVKPSNSGSSIGIKKANSKEELMQAIEFAAKYDNKILAEKAVDAREIECSVIGNNVAQASCVGEIVPAEDFYSFDAKYNNSESKLIIPAELNNEIAEQIRKMAIKAYKAVDAKGLARVDFFVEKETNKIYLNEINTMPGFTLISMYPQLWKKCGKPYAKLLDELVESASTSK